MPCLWMLEWNLSSSVVITWSSRVKIGEDALIASRHNEILEVSSSCRMRNSRCFLVANKGSGCVCICKCYLGMDKSARSIGCINRQSGNVSNVIPRWYHACSYTWQFAASKVLVTTWWFSLGDVEYDASRQVWLHMGYVCIAYADASYVHLSSPLCPYVG